MQLSQKNKVCFVTPWFGESIPGGAEAETRDLIKSLGKSFDVEVLTTCIKDFQSDWNENHLKEGEYFENGVFVRRFKADKIDRFNFHQINRLLMQGKKPDKDEERTYLDGIVKSAGLKRFIADNKDKYKHFFFIPYMFGTTIDGIFSAAEKSVLIPCLHDESYAYMEVFKKMFSICHRVFFHVDAEKRLAERLYGKNENFRLVGEGIDTEISVKPDLFCEKYALKNYFVYVGRKDMGKNLPLLLNYFEQYLSETSTDLKLLLIGPGGKILDRKNVIDLGFIPLEDKLSAISGSLFLCQPSVNESFSLVLMEAGLLKRPVLVNSNCEVTRDHCLDGNMGLFFKDYFEFYEAVRFFENNLEAGNLMGESGRRYVLNNYSREKVLNNILLNL